MQLNQLSKAIIEVALIFGALLVIFYFVRGTKGAGMLKGLGVALVVLFTLVYFLANELGLETINFALDGIVIWAVIALVIIFQPEIRRTLTKLGQNPLWLSERKGSAALIREISDAALWLAERRFGAIVAIEGEVGLNNFAEGGVEIDGQVSAQLLKSIFFPDSALHDGAVIIQDGRISAASCFLPLSDNPASADFGSRHRAALGLCEETDALVLVVSEEKGTIRIASGGLLSGNLTQEDLQATIEKAYTRKAS